MGEINTPTRKAVYETLYNVTECDRSGRSVTRSYLASFSSTAISACRSSSPGGKTLNGLCRLSQQNSLSEGGIAFLVEPLQLRVQVL